MSDNRIDFVVGIPEAYRQQAVQIYNTAFQKKFAQAISDAGKRYSIFQDAPDLEFAIGTFTDENLLGLTGFKTDEGALTGGISFSLLTKYMGLWSALKAGLVFSLFDRQPEPHTLLMDGICVDENWRGFGIGTGSLNRLKNYARENGYSTIRLDVISTNEVAKRLYERQGFQVSSIQKLGIMKYVLGFEYSSKMLWENSQ